MKKGGRIMLIILSVLLMCILCLAGILLIMSPGKPVLYLDKNGDLLAGSISEKIYVDINGMKQGMFIQSKDSANPVLLYLHGGIPVYFFHGIYDYTVSYNLARAYFEKLKAPVKGFYTFRQSAHSPMFEEPEKTIKILQADVLQGSNSLADK
jgi:pimeloyl-ACP methyl ester carboxylesterase